MNKENALTRKKLKQIDSVEDFDRMLNNLMASEEDKKIIEMHYKQGKVFGIHCRCVRYVRIVCQK